MSIYLSLSHLSVSHLSIRLSIRMLVYPSIYQSIYLSKYHYIYICLFVCLSLCLCISIYLSIYLCISIYLSTYLSISISLSISLSFYLLSVYLSVYLSIYLSIYLSTYMSDNFKSTTSSTPPCWQQYKYSSKVWHHKICLILVFQTLHGGCTVASNPLQPPPLLSTSTSHDEVALRWICSKMSFAPRREDVAPCSASRLRDGLNEYARDNSRATRKWRSRFTSPVAVT
jgi:hypothetical protein